MKRDSNTSIIPKIIILLGTLSVIGIILLFLRTRPQTTVRPKRVEPTQDLFTQVIQASIPKLLQLWEEGDRFLPKTGLNCPAEIVPDPKVGRSYFQCQPHFWQCYWETLSEGRPLEVDVFGQTFHLEAFASYPAIPSFSEAPRFYEAFHQTSGTLPTKVGYKVEIGIKEFPGKSQTLVLSDSCRDTYLPERIYGQGQVKDKSDEGFVWDNFDRKIFIDKFYVSNQKVNEWRVLSGKTDKLILDRSRWPEPALLSLAEQKQYCHFYGKRLLEAKLFDAATMTPADLKNPTPELVIRPATPWQRDMSRSFLGMARINPDYQLTPLDCQLAQVKGCPDKFFTTDSATWMGIYFALGFYPESLTNAFEPKKNLKASSKFLVAASEWHELGKLSSWDGIQDKTPVAFRCYEEVSQ